MKRALVLEGGGAKGAYQFGALLALRELGLDFDVIAGSSVGALNGAIAATRNYARGARYWWNLKPYSVLKLKYLTPFTIILEPLYWLGMALRSLIQGIASDYPGTQKERAYSLLGGSLAVGAILGVLGIFEREFLSSALIVLLTGGGLGFIVSLPYWLNAAGWSAFDPRPLSDLVDEIISGKPLSARLWVTVSYEKDIFDPDAPAMAVCNDPRFRNMYPPPPAMPMVPVFVRELRHFPEYELANRAPELFRGLLLASAALPHGVFPPLEIRGRTCVDGGVADNLPVFPALAEGGIDELVVICLRPTKPEALKLAWQKAQRARRLAEASPEPWAEYTRELSVRSDPPRRIPYAEPGSWPERTILIAPERSFGTFLTATLNFSRSKAQRLMQLGWRDARRALGERAKALPARIPAELLPKDGG